MYSRKLAEFTSQLRYEDLPQDVLTLQKMYLDIIGVAIGGSHKPASEIWLDTLNSFGDRRSNYLDARFPKTSYLYASCANAAFVMC